MKKPVALILTDTHLNENNIDLVKSIWIQAVIKCQELGIRKMLFGGDFFTSRKAQPLSVDEAGREIMNNICISGIDIIMIKGNHDCVDLESESSYLDEYAKYENCRIVKSYYSDASLSKELVVHFIPYFKEDTAYFDLLDKAVKLTREKTDKIHILLTHIAVNGVRNNDGSVVENNLISTQFDHFDKVLVGHYHNQSFIEPNIHYIGSAYQANYGEDVNKGFTIIHDDGSLEFIQSKFKKYIQVKLDIENPKAIQAAQKQYADSADNVRFVIQGEEGVLKSINKETFSALGIEVTFNKDSAVPMNNEDLVQKANSVSFDRHNIIEAFDVFCQTKHIEDNSIGKSYLEKI